MTPGNAGRNLLGMNVLSWLGSMEERFKHPAPFRELKALILAVGCFLNIN
jgi:hypothetical protein